MRIFEFISKQRYLKKNAINANTPRKLGITKEKRKEEVIISLTSFPARINFIGETLNCLLNQTVLPDRVILWLSDEQFPDKDTIPKNILKLQKYGLEIRWCHDIRSYKKLIPTLREFPNAIVVTVDDDWFYPENMLEILLHEHEQHPDEIICHAVTHPLLNENNRLTTNTETSDYRGTSSYFHKVLTGSGTLVKKSMLDDLIFDETLFMTEASTNDDIYVWAMAVKNGTKIRQPKHALGLFEMTNPTEQCKTALSLINSQNELYEKTTNRMLELFPEILNNLLSENNI